MSIFTEEIGKRGISPLPQANHRIISNRGSRISNFTKRPPWSIPSISGMVNQTDSTEKMVVRDIILGANISNNLADMTLSQTFRNTTERSVECVYQFPISEEFVVSGITAIMENKTIETQIMEKEKANQKYDDTIAQGNTAIKMEYDEENQKVLTLNIGHLQKNKEVQIIIRISTKCHSFKHGEYTFVFPLNFLPSFMSMEDNQFKVIKPTFSCKIKLKWDSEITNLSTSHEELAHLSTPDGHLLEFENLDTFDRKDIVVSYSYETIRQLELRFYSSSKHPDELVGHLSGLPRISPELNYEENKFEVNENHSLDVNNDEPEIASGEFIFFIDRSYSMNGSRISSAKEALKLFIRSLPEGSKFNIVSFGSEFKLFKPTSIDFDEESLNQAIKDISKFDADMGGTEILAALKHIYRTIPDPAYPKNIFLLTDGQIFNKSNVIQEISQNASKARLHTLPPNHPLRGIDIGGETRVHTFGIGDSVDKHLIKECARAGKGSYSFVGDDESELNTKVISALKEALRPSMSNITIDWKEFSEAFKYKIPTTEKDNEQFNSLYTSYEDTYEEEPIHLFAIFNKEALFKSLEASSESQILLQYLNSLNKQKVSVSQRIDLSEKNITENDSAFILAAQKVIKRLETIPDEVQELLHHPSSKISQKYSTLAQSTSFFGKIKNMANDGEEMSLLKIKTIQNSQDSFRINRAHTIPDWFSYSPIHQGLGFNIADIGSRITLKNSSNARGLGTPGYIERNRMQCLKTTNFSQHLQFSTQKSNRLLSNESMASPNERFCPKMASPEYSYDTNKDYSSPHYMPMSMNSSIALPWYEAKPPKYAPPVQIKADKMLFEAKIHHKRERSRDRDRRKSDSRKSRRIRRRVQPDSDSSNESLERRNRDNGDKRNRDIKCLDRARMMKDEEVLGHKKKEKNLCGEENFKQIINLQSFDGSFKSIAPFIIIPEMPSDLKSLNLPTPLLQHLFFTLLSLTTLSLKFPSTSPQWSLIYTKGLKFLQKHIQSSTLSKILTSTKSLLSQM